MRRAWRLLLALAVICVGGSGLGGALFSAACRSSRRRIRDISVDGQSACRARDGSLLPAILAGDAYDAGKVDALAQGAVRHRPLRRRPHRSRRRRVIVTVVENPVVNQVAFEGNTEVDTETLRNEVQLKPRSVFTRARVQADVQRILDVYRRQGRFAATVEPKIIELEQNRVNLVFEITEGNATKVKGINFIGNYAFSDSQLRDIISTTQSGWFDFLKGTSIYDPDRMSLDRELLRQYYLKNGYADAQRDGGQRRA